jgi:hypothetical protein
LTESGMCVTSWPDNRLPLFLGIFGLFAREEFLEQTTHTRHYKGYFYILFYNGIRIPPSTGPKGILIIIGIV